MLDQPQAALSKVSKLIKQLLVSIVFISNSEIVVLSLVLDEENYGVNLKDFERIKQELVVAIVNKVVHTHLKLDYISVLANIVNVRLYPDHEAHGIDSTNKSTT